MVSSSLFDWRSLFVKEASSSFSATLIPKKFEIVYENGRGVALDNVEKGTSNWNSYIVGFFLGRRHAFPTVRRLLQNKWKLKEPLSITLDKDFFYLKVEDEDDKRKIIDSKPIFLLGRAFLLQ